MNQTSILNIPNLTELAKKGEHEKGGKEYEMPAHHQSFLISWLFAKSSVPTRHTRTRPEVCCQDRHPNSPPRSAP